MFQILNLILFTPLIFRLIAHRGTRTIPEKNNSTYITRYCIICKAMNPQPLKLDLHRFSTQESESMLSMRPLSVLEDAMAELMLLPHEYVWLRLE